MHLAQFFPVPASPDVGAALAALPEFPAGLHGCLVTGPAHSGKTALLWQYAYRVAAAGGSVLMLCSRCAAPLCSALPSAVQPWCSPPAS